jgi:hypothetical protein
VIGTYEDEAVLASRNRNKLAEMREILTAKRWRWFSSPMRARRSKWRRPALPLKRTPS